MNLIDSHCHLQSILKETPGLTAQNLINDQFSGENHLRELLCVCITISEADELRRIAALDQRVKISIGQHPNDVDGVDPAVFSQQLDSLLASKDFSAIGETGLDYYRESNQTIQKELFSIHIELAKKHQLPLIIHTRQAREDTIDCLKVNHAEKAGGIFHCFTESWEMAKEGLGLGFYISFSGIITFKNAAEVRAVVEKVPLTSLLIETDSPYLAPVPFRGKVNQPKYVYWVAKTVADIKGISIEKVIEQTHINYQNIFANHA